MVTGHTRPAGRRTLAFESTTAHGAGTTTTQDQPGPVERDEPRELVHSIGGAGAPITNSSAPPPSTSASVAGSRTPNRRSTWAAAIPNRCPIVDGHRTCPIFAPGRRQVVSRNARTMARLDFV